MTKNQLAKVRMPRWALLSATALATVTALVYLAIGLGMVPDDFKSPPAALMVVAGVAYLVGGGLILVADRRLMMVGAVANVLVLILFVVSAVVGNATLDGLSLSGKAAQVVLGLLLVWFVIRMGERRDKLGTSRPSQ